MNTSLEKVQWLEDYELGDPRLDKDHKNLVGIVNLTVNALNSGHMTESLALMRQFISAARDHFAVEEELMATCDFANARRHQNYHQHLLERAEQIEAVFEFDQDEQKIRDQFVEFVSCLLDDVIQGDRELLPILKRTPQATA